MKQEILDLIRDKPKQYVRIIKASTKLLDWVNQNKLFSSDNTVEEIYSAIHQVDNVCPNGNKRKIRRISKGFIGCGPTSKCQCTKEAISKNVSIAKQARTDEQNAISNKLREDTMTRVYGVTHNLKREDVKEVIRKPKIKIEIYNKLNDKNWLLNEYVTNHKSLVHLAKELSVNSSTVAFYCDKHNIEIINISRSQYELYLAKLIKEKYNTIVLESVRTIIPPKEIDIWLPDYNLAIEFNGRYWHHPDKHGGETQWFEYHQGKIDSCESQGIKLLHLWEDYADHEKLIASSIHDGIINNNLSEVYHDLFKS